MAEIGRSHTASSVAYRLRPIVPTSGGGGGGDGNSQEPALGERCNALMPELEEYISYICDRVVNAEELTREIEARPIRETRSVVWVALLDVLRDNPDSWSLYRNRGITNLIINAVLAHGNSSNESSANNGTSVR